MQQLIKLDTEKLEYKDDIKTIKLTNPEMAV